MIYYLVGMAIFVVLFMYVNKYNKFITQQDLDHDFPSQWLWLIFIILLYPVPVGIWLFVQVTTFLERFFPKDRD